MRGSAKELALELENVILKIQESYEDACKEQQRLDLMCQDVLHHMENNEFNANQGYKYAKAIQVISQERRLVKSEHSVLQGLYNRVSPFQKEILKSTKRAITASGEMEKLIIKGQESYNPRIIRSLDKNDVLNQVVEILNNK